MENELYEPVTGKEAVESARFLDSLSLEEMTEVLELTHSDTKIRLWEILTAPQ